MSGEVSAWGSGESEVIVVYAQQEAPTSWQGSVFLAGPTPRSPDVASWRPAAIDLLRGLWRHGRLVVFAPESTEGGFRGTWESQVGWEDDCLHAADVIAFWIPRDMRTLPGLTTNVEWGRWEASGKVVLGAPPQAPATRYLRHYAARHHVPTEDTLEATMGAALVLLGRLRGSSSEL